MGERTAKRVTMQRSRMYTIISISIAAVVLTAIFAITSYISNKEESVDVSVNKGVYIAYETNRTYHYLPDEMNVNSPEEEGHVFIPTRFREKKDSLVYEKIDIDESQYRITPVSADEAAPAGDLEAYKITYVTNIEPQRYIRLLCNGIQICALPITEKGVEQFKYETVVCLSPENKVCNLNVMDEEDTSDYIVIRKDGADTK